MGNSRSTEGAVHVVVPGQVTRQAVVEGVEGVGVDEEFRGAREETGDVPEGVDGRVDGAPEVEDGCGMRRRRAPWGDLPGRDVADVLLGEGTTVPGVGDSRGNNRPCPGVGEDGVGGSVRYFHQRRDTYEDESRGRSSELTLLGDPQSLQEEVVTQDLLVPTTTSHTGPGPG